MALWKIYVACLAQAQIDLSAQSAAVQRAVAAYMTLGSFGHVGQVLVDVQTHFGVTLDRFLYPNAGDRWFAADKDMDRDGATNKEEWDYAVAQTAEAKSSSSSAAAAAYVASVPDPGEGGGAPPPLPDTGEASDFVSDCAGPMFDVAVLNVSNLAVIARVTTPDGSENAVVSEGQVKAFPAGVEVKVEATEAAWFASWSAPDSLLDGSGQALDSFILTGPTTIRASMKGTSVVEHSDNAYEQVTLSVAGGDEPLVLERGEGEVSDRYIKVREGTLLSAVVTRRNSPITWIKLTLSRRTGAHAGQRAVIDPTDVKVAEGKSGYVPPHGLGAIGARASNSVATANSNSGTKIEPFVSETLYAIPHDPAVTWESAIGAEFKLDLGYYVYDIVSPRATNLNPNATATADVWPKNTLAVMPAECEGDGCVCDQHGGVHLENARRYYLGKTAATANAELVGLSARANPGHVLKGLRIEGGGRVFIWDGHGQVDDFLSLEDMEEVPEPNEEGLYEGEETYYLEMASNATVTPVVCLCSHEGTVNDGYLIGDTKLVAKTGYTTVSDNRYGCLHWALEKIRRVGESWAASKEYTFAVGRISQLGGGSVTPGGQPVQGSSHRNGLDVDVRYIRKDHTGAQLDLSGSLDLYDQEATQELVDLFVAEGAIMIITTPDAELDTGSATRLFLPGHTDHFHVRFSDPD